MQLSYTMKEGLKKQYRKPKVTIIHLEPLAIICTSSDASFHLGGAGVYDGDVIIDNGDY